MCPWNTSWTAANRSFAILDNFYKFTGFERDGESALDHTLHRKYSASLARWLSPDPEAGEPIDPQSWNRYAYVVNNPLLLVDPLGGKSQYTNFVGCFPDHMAYITGDYGCGYDPEEGCPPGFVTLTGDVGPGQGKITIQSLMQYANSRLAPHSDFLSYGRNSNGIDVSISGDWINSVVGAGTVDGNISLTLTNLADIMTVGDLVDVLGVIKDFQKARNQGELSLVSCERLDNAYVIAVDVLAVAGTYCATRGIPWACKTALAAAGAAAAIKVLQAAWCQEPLF